MDIAPSNKPDWTTYFGRFTSAAMYITFISSNATAELVFNDLNYPEKSVTITFFVVAILTALLQAYVELFNLLAALAVYDITKRLHKVVYSRTDLNIRFLLTCYERMWTDVNKINEVNSGVMLVVYLRVLAWLSTVSVTLMQVDNWLGRVYLLLYSTLTAVTFILAAEANKKVNVCIKKVAIWHSNTH